MAYLRFTDVQDRPTEFLDLTSLTLDEFQLLVPPFEAALQAHLAVWRLDGKPRTTCRLRQSITCGALPLRGPHVHGKGTVGGIGGITVEKLDAHHIVVDIFHHRALAHGGALGIIQGKVHAERLVEADGMLAHRPKAEALRRHILDDHRFGAAPLGQIVAVVLILPGQMEGTPHALPDLDADNKPLATDTGDGEGCARRKMRDGDGFRGATMGTDHHPLPVHRAIDGLDILCDAHAAAFFAPVIVACNGDMPRGVCRVIIARPAPLRMPQRRDVAYTTAGRTACAPF